MSGNLMLNDFSFHATSKLAPSVCIYSHRHHCNWHCLQHTNNNLMSTKSLG